MPPNQYRLPDTFQIHYDGIDREHNRLVEIINDCSAIILDGSRDVLCNRLTDLVVTMHEHFANEEAHMRQLGYNGLDWHAEHHREAVAHTEQLLQRARTGDIEDQSLLHALFNDIVNDVARADLKFRDFLEAEGLIDVPR